jgi:dipeptidyl-peptidase-4
MTKLLSTMGTLCVSISLSAQAGIIQTRPANEASGKILSMEETILSQSLAPANLWCRWTDDTHIAMYKNGKWVNYDIATTDTVKYVPKVKYPHIYNKGNNLYIRNQAPENGKAPEDLTIAESQDKNISYGGTVSRNEFGIGGGIFMSPDSSKVAFYRKDESKVTAFPLLDITTRTGSLKEIKYPMAGMDSELIELGIHDLKTGTTHYIKADEFTAERYLTNVTWSPDNSRIFIQVLDRSQKHMKLNMYDALTGDYIKTILTEDNEKYVEPLDPLYFIKGQDDTFIYRTANRDGYRSLYLCDTDGKMIRITTADADVAYIKNDGEYIYYTSAEVSPVENHLFRIRIKNLKKGTFGKPERLTEAPGWHNIAMSPDCRHYTDTYSSLTVPCVVDLRSCDGRLIKNLLTAEDPTTSYAYTEISLGTVKSADGRYDNYYRLIKPKDFDSSKKYPVIVYVYGGPHSQMVKNTFMGQLRRWEMYMAQRGYIVYVQDNRGTQNRGIEFEQAIHGQCGQAEMADQMEGVKMLMELPYVDKDRIGVHGWSYGGFMTISLITNYPDVFKVAVAGGPVIDWKWYEVMYGERYMDHPETNPEGYAKTSLIGKAKDLKGKLLICQGAIDPVVVWEHSLSFVRECIKNNVQVDYFPYPCAEHNVMGKDRVHLHDKISMYFEDYL